MNFGYIRKALMAGAGAAITALVTFNVQGWLDGTEKFDAKSVIYAVGFAYLSGMHTYWVSNKAPVAPEAPQPPDGQAA